jgi:hypothetical protein
MAWDTQTEEIRDRAIWWAGGIIIVGLIGLGVYYRFFMQAPAPLPEKTQLPQLVPPRPITDEDVVEHPIPENKEPEAGLPPLNDSDQLVHDSLAGLFDPRLVEQMLNPENIVRHIVATVDNLPRHKVAVEVRPLKMTPGSTLVSTHGDTTVIAEANYARYAPFLKALRSADPKQLAAVYFRLYPLFQHAYEDLGYPNKYFNDRLIQTIDDMLKAPELPGAIQVVQPKVFYEFSDPDLEERSAGQKLIMRMGPAHEREIKEKLRALRAEILKNESAVKTQGK